MIEVGEGLGSPVAIAPGGAAIFGFTVKTAAMAGLGVRANPDRVSVRLRSMNAARTIQSGVSMLRNLAAGRYLLEATIPPGRADDAGAPGGSLGSFRTPIRRRRMSSAP